MSKVKCKFVTEGICSGKITRKLSYFLGVKRRVYRNICDAHYKDHLVLMSFTELGEKIFNKVVNMTKEKRWEKFCNSVSDPEKVIGGVEKRYAITVYSNKHVNALLENKGLNPALVSKMLKGLKRVRREFR